MQLNNTVKIGGKSVKVKKIVVEQWRDLFGAVHAIPHLILGLIERPLEERATFMLFALEQALDDVLDVVHTLTGFDKEWLEKNASLDELVAYFIAVAKMNNFAESLKNVQGVLSLGKAVTDLKEQNAN